MTPLLAALALLPFQGFNFVVVHPKPTDEILTNPNMGLYLFGTLNPAQLDKANWFDKAVPIGYFRDDWAVINPKGPGNQDFAAYFEPIFDLWVKKHKKRVAFRFMSENMHSQATYVTPKWVFDKGVPSVKLKGLYNPAQVDPVFWDERYLEIQEKFIADLGEYLDGREGVEFVDIGGIGEWGEMHLARWSTDILRECGFTHQRYVAAYRRIIEAYAKAFRKTPVFLNIGDHDEINDYAATRGIHFRQDGLRLEGPSADVGNRFIRPYSVKRIRGNYELFTGYDDMTKFGWKTIEVFKKGLEDPISYLHINLYGYDRLRSAGDDVKEAVELAARRVGYRFELQELRHNRKSHGRLLINTKWRNVGVAPCLESHGIVWALARNGKVEFKATCYPSQPTTFWSPSQDVVLSEVIPLPGTLATGDYQLLVGMADGTIQLPLAGRRADGLYPLSTVQVETAKEVTSIIYTQDFGTPHDWTPQKGMSQTVEMGALHLVGTQEGAWNYASTAPMPLLLPGSLYRFTCRMKVDQLGAGANPPYLKIGLTDPKGKWIENVNTAKYDMSRKGEWQTLTGYAETSDNVGGGHLAVEKGTTNSATASLWIDDVKVELLEAP